MLIHGPTSALTHFSLTPRSLFWYLAMVAENPQCGFLSCHSGREMEEIFFLLLACACVWSRKKCLCVRPFTCVWECVMLIGRHWNAAWWLCISHNNKGCNLFYLMQIKLLSKHCLFSHSCFDLWTNRRWWFHISLLVMVEYRCGIWMVNNS